MLIVVVEKDNQQRLDNRPRIIWLDYDDSALADRDEIGMPDRDSTSIRQTDVKCLERFSMERQTNAF
jgi:hypothetical protein